jgi:hypothetical protein
MNLTKFEFPKDAMNTNKELLAEAKERGFYNGRTKYNKLFSTLFFSGGSVDFKKDIDEDFRKNAWQYCRKFMGSWSPKHEEKEAICAMIMSEIIEA